MRPQLQDKNEKKYCRAAEKEIYICMMSDHVYAIDKRLEKSTVRERRNYHGFTEKTETTSRRRTDPQYGARDESGQGFPDLSDVCDGWRKQS